MSLEHSSLTRKDWGYLVLLFSVTSESVIVGAALLLVAVIIGRPFSRGRV